MFGYKYVEVVLIRQRVIDLPVMVIDAMEDLVQVKDAVDDGLGDLVEL